MTTNENELHPRPSKATKPRNLTEFLRNSAYSRLEKAIADYIMKQQLSFSSDKLKKELLDWIYKANITEHEKEQLASCYQAPAKSFYSELDYDFFGNPRAYWVEIHETIKPFFLWEKKWKTRLEDENIFIRSFWKVIYYAGSIFTFGKWHPKSNCEGQRHSAMSTNSTLPSMKLDQHDATVPNERDPLIPDNKLPMSSPSSSQFFPKVVKKTLSLSGLDKLVGYANDLLSYLDKEKFLGNIQDNAIIEHLKDIFQGKKKEGKINHERWYDDQDINDVIASMIQHDPAIADPSYRTTPCINRYVKVYTHLSTTYEIELEVNKDTFNCKVSTDGNILIEKTGIKRQIAGNRVGYCLLEENNQKRVLGSADSSADANSPDEYLWPKLQEAITTTLDLNNHDFLLQDSPKTKKEQLLYSRDVLAKQFREHEWLAVLGAVDQVEAALPIDYFLNKHSKSPYGDETIAAVRANDVFAEIINKLQVNDTARILFPYNKTQAHWVTGEIQIKKTADHHYAAEVYSHDPFGGGSMAEKAFKVIESAITTRIREEDPHASFDSIENKVSPYPRRQAKGDNVSCGVITAEDIVSIIKTGKPRDPDKEILVYGEPEIREKHAAFIKKHVPNNLGFAKRNRQSPENPNLIKEDKTWNTAKFVEAISKLEDRNLQQGIWFVLNDDNQTALLDPDNEKYDPKLYWACVISAVEDLPVWLASIGMESSAGDISTTNQLTKLLQPIKEQLKSIEKEVVKANKPNWCRII